MLPAIAKSLIFRDEKSQVMGPATVADNEKGQPSLLFSIQS
jgi:hypothetical protein